MLPSQTSQTWQTCILMLTMSQTGCIAHSNRQSFYSPAQDFLLLMHSPLLSLSSSSDLCVNIDCIAASLTQIGNHSSFQPRFSPPHAFSYLILISAHACSLIISFFISIPLSFSLFYFPSFLLILILLLLLLVSSGFPPSLSLFQLPFLLLCQSIDLWFPSPVLSFQFPSSLILLESYSLLLVSFDFPTLFFLCLSFSLPFSLFFS